MWVSLRDYDFGRAQAILRAHVDRDAGTGYSWDNTLALRTLDGAEHAVDSIGWAAMHSFQTLSRDDGGWYRRDDEWPIDHPLMRIVRRLPSHPSWKPWTSQDANMQRGMDVIRRGSALPWSVPAVLDDVIDGIRTYMGDAQVSTEAPPWDLRQSTRIDRWMRTFLRAVTYDEFGAFDPAFTRGDALAGDVWLLQPVSPRLVHREIGHRVGVELLGYLPPRWVDVPGRVVMVCIDRVPAPVDHRISIIEDTKWLAGWAHLRWRRGELPVGDPGFALIDRLELPEHDSGGPDRYGPYRHSSELPSFPPQQWPWDR